MIVSSRMLKIEKSDCNKILQLAPYLCFVLSFIMQFASSWIISFLSSSLTSVWSTFRKADLRIIIISAVLIGSWMIASSKLF